MCYTDNLTTTKGYTMWDGFDSTADALEDWHYSRIDADLEMAEMQRMAAEREHDRRNGNCWHDSGYGFRPVAFYPEQVGLTQGQMHCADCGEKVATEPDCYACGLDRYNCMGERGYGDSCTMPHDAFVTPPMVLVSVAPPEGF